MDGSDGDTLNWQVNVEQAQGVKENDVGEIPIEPTLCPPSPNPFNSSTDIRFSLPSASLVNLKLFDLAGREVSTLIEGNLSPGLHLFHLFASDLPAGLYFLRLDAGENAQTRKIVVVN